jgi:apolipoprotein N-acyltransferase
MRWRRPAVAFAAGLLLTAALPPFGWWPLAIAGVALLVHLLEDEEGREPPRRLILGYAAALGFLIPGLWWMHEFTAPGYGLACLFESLLLTIGIAIGRGWTLPAGIVLAESLRASWPFGGVPVPTIAQTQADGPFAPLVRVGGELLLAACVLALGVAVAQAWRRGW